MSRVWANLIAFGHAVWILAVIILPGTDLYWLVPFMLFVALVANWFVGECPFLIWEWHFRRGVPISMSRRLFRLIGLRFSEAQTGGLIIALSVHALILSGLRWWTG